MNARHNKHSGRIERSGGLKVIAGLTNTRRVLWERACKHDNIDPAAKIVVFSDDNPFVPFLNRISQEIAEAIREYQSGGYVRLSLKAA